MSEDTATLSTDNTDVKVTVTDHDEEVEETPTKEDIPQKDIDQAVKQAEARGVEYSVDGYGRSDDGYGGPYHPDAFLDPKVQYALAGTAEAAAEYQKELHEVEEDRVKSQDGACDKVDTIAGSAHTTIVEMAEFRALKDRKDIDLPSTPDNIALGQDAKDAYPSAASASDEDTTSIHEPENVEPEHRNEPGTPGLTNDAAVPENERTDETNEQVKDVRFE